MYKFNIHNISSVRSQVVILTKGGIDQLCNIIAHYNPSSRIIDRVSHTTYVVCVNFIHKCRLKSTANDRCFEKLFMALLFAPRVFARNLLRRNRRKNTFCILFWSLVWGSNRDLSSNKPTHYLLDHDDFNWSIM